MGDGDDRPGVLLEVPFEWERSLAILFEGLPLARIGQVSDQPRLTIFGSETNTLLVNAGIYELKQAWQAPLQGIV